MKIENMINKIFCADCLELMKDMKDNSVDLVVTSPPYNMRTRVRNGQYTTREKSEHFSKKYKYYDDAMPINEYYFFHKSTLAEMMRISSLVFWNVSIVTGSKEAIFRIIGDYHKEIKDIIVWDKGWGQPAMHEAVINRGYELIIIFQNGAMAGRAFNKSYFKRGTMPDMWRHGAGISNKTHSACFPVELPIDVILGWSKENDLILDPFIGSGTTAIAAIRTNRRYIGIDIEEKYCELARKRIFHENQQLKLDL